MEEREDEWAQRRMPKFPFAIGGFLTDRPERTSRGKGRDEAGGGLSFAHNLSMGGQPSVPGEKG